METQFQQIRDQQKETWNKFSTGWRKWDELTMDFLKPVGDKIIDLIDPKPGELILDVASGTGEPGLTIARMVMDGKVISSDISEGMLEVAMDHAREQGIANFETRVCDVSELPFPDNYFDAISCRFGFMFFPDMLQAAKEITRVLKPGGRVATSVWYKPEKNFWVNAIMGTINKNIELPPPVPGAPGIFRCAADRLIADLFRQAGLKNISETEVMGKLKAGNAETYWNMMTEVGAPIVAALSKADEVTTKKIKTEVYELVSTKYNSGEVNIDSCALVIYGEK